MMEPELAPAEEIQTETPVKTEGYKPLLWLALGVLTAFVAISGYVLWDGRISDETKGAIISTWNNLAVMVASFWFGSNVASKVQRLKGQ